MKNIQSTYRRMKRLNESRLRSYHQFEIETDAEFFESEIRDLISRELGLRDARQLMDRDFVTASDYEDFLQEVADESVADRFGVGDPKGEEIANDFYEDILGRGWSRMTHSTALEVMFSFLEDFYRKLTRYS